MFVCVVVDVCGEGSLGAECWVVCPKCPVGWRVLGWEVWFESRVCLVNFFNGVWVWCLELGVTPNSFVLLGIAVPSTEVGGCAAVCKFLDA